jgi:L-iditol 2-dehydrogenase
MRALLYTESFDLEVRDLDEPLPAAGELLVRVEAAGICASDVHGVSSRSPRRTPPLVMGHELTGEVVAAGPGADAALVGRRIAINPQVTCGDCLWCRSGKENICQFRELVGGTRPGGFAELVAVPARCAHVVEDGARADDVVLAEPLATCVHALCLLPDRLVGTAVVLGAGTIGMLAAQLLRETGTRRVIVSEPSLERHDVTRSVADVVVAPDDLPDAVAELTDGVGADLSFDAVGTGGTRAESLRALRAGGAALWLGMHAQDSQVPAFDMVVRETSAIGSFAYTNAEFAHALGLLASGRYAPALTRRRVPLGESDVTFKRLLDGDLGGVHKEIVCP